MALATGASLAHAACNTIPSATRSFRGALGGVDRPFAVPGRFLELRVQPEICDAASPGLAERADQHVVTLVFTPPSGALRNVVVLATDCASLESARLSCEARSDVATATCIAVNQVGEPPDLVVVERDAVRRLQVRFPDTDGLLPPDTDGLTLSGPAAMAVTQPAAPLPCGLAQQRCADALALPGLIACVDELYARDGTCRTTAGDVDQTFGHFTALPPPNDYQALCTEPTSVCAGSTAANAELRFAVDAAGNALVPINWRGILVRAGSVPVPRLLRGSTAVSATALGGPIVFPGPEFVASYTLEGVVLPPIFEPQVDPRASNELTLFGSADSPETVLRVARRQPVLACAGGTRDGLPCGNAGDCPEGGVCGPDLAFFACIGGSRDALPCTEPADCSGGTCAPTRCQSGAPGSEPCVRDSDCSIGECGPALFDFRDRLEDGVGPVIVPRLGAEQGVCEEGPNPGALCTAPDQCGVGLCVGYRLEAETPVPIEGLAGTGNLLTLVVDEAVAGRDLNGDSDSLDTVLTLRNRLTGEVLPIGRGTSPGVLAEGIAVTRIRRPPFSFPAFAAEGDTVAFLQSEASEGDLNGDLDRADSILRMFRGQGADALELTAGFPPVVDAEPVINDAAVAVSGGRVFARLPETASGLAFTGRVSVTTALEEANGPSGAGDRGMAFAAIQPFLAFTSAASNLVAGDTNARDDVFVAGGTDAGGIPALASMARVSVSSTGAEANGHSGMPSISSDGRFVAFASDADDLVAGDGDGLGDVFVHDRDADGNGVFDEVGGIATVRVSVDFGGADANGSTFAPSLSNDGRFVAFESVASDLVGSDTNGVADVFVHDRDTDRDGIYDEPDGRSTVRVSVDSEGAEANGASVFPEISADGRFVAFASSASDLVPGDQNGTGDVFVHDRDADRDGVFDEAGDIATVRVSVDSAGTEGDGDSLSRPSLSADGSVVAFDSIADNLVAGDVNGVRDVFVRYRLTGQTVRASVDAIGRPGDAASASARLSASGRWVAFESLASMLVPDDANGVADAFVHDLLTGVTVRASHATAFSIEGGNGASVRPAISADGRFTAFRSAATNLDFLVADTNLVDDVYLGGSFGGDINGDGDPDDTLLMVIETTDTNVGFAQLFCPATEVAVTTGRAVFLRPEAAGHAAGCPGGGSLNGDADIEDAVVHLWPGPAVAQNLACAGKAVAASSTWLAALIPEAAQGGTDLNGDADASDTVAAVHLVAGTPSTACTGAGSQWIHLGQAADTVRVIDVEVAGGTIVSVVAVTTPEAAQGEDLNADGDMDDRVLQLWTLDPLTNTASKVTGVDQAAEELVLRGTLIAFRTPEAAEGQDLNGDGDLTDFVLDVYDVAANTVHRTGQAATPCQLQACDPRQPYRVTRDGVRFLTRESEQSADLNNDGDALDLVVQLLNVRTGVVNTIATVEDVSAEVVDPLGGGDVDDETGTQVFVSEGRCLEPVAGTCNGDAECPNGAACVDGRCALDHGPCATEDDCPEAADCRPEPTVVAILDSDRDGFPDPVDLCPSIVDPAQVDTDGDGVGDACDQETPVTTSTSSMATSSTSPSTTTLSTSSTTAITSTSTSTTASSTSSTSTTGLASTSSTSTTTTSTTSSTTSTSSSTTTSSSTSTTSSSTSTTSASTSTTSTSTSTMVGANRAPDCTRALATPSELWPPNRKLSQISITGVQDPDGDDVAITITALRQDEPPAEKGGANVCPDGEGVGTPRANLRAERSGSGRGRIYHVRFEASDGRGGKCEGTVKVCVPHELRSANDCVDQGPQFDSTGPCQ